MPSTTSNPETTSLLHHPSTCSPSSNPALFHFNLALGLPLTTTSSPPVTLSYSTLRSQSSGLYKSILTQHSHYRFQYHVLEAIYYFSLFLQFLIGAFLTLATPAHITVLGIVNSCLVGVLGLLKSQRLPEKAAGNEFEMRKVRDWVEECEGRLVGGWGEEDVDGLVEEAWDRYAAAMEVVQGNRLGRFGAVSNRGKGGEVQGRGDAKNRPGYENDWERGATDRSQNMMDPSNQSRS